MRLAKFGFVYLLALLASCNPALAAFEVPVTIANGGSLSTAADLTPFIAIGAPTPIAIIMPAAWTAASITAQFSTDGCSTFSNAFVQAGTEYTITSPAASEYIILTPSDLVGVNCLKLRSGTSGSPVTQGAARTLNILIK